MKLRWFLTAFIAVIIFMSGALQAYALADVYYEPEAVITSTPEPAPVPTPVTTPEPPAVKQDNPLSVDGTGTVLDSATAADDKAFYTITTEAGNVFFLIIDHQKEADNVYFLNAVTEEDLMALAEKSEDDGDDGSESAIPTPQPTPEPTVPVEEHADTDGGEDEQTASKKGGSGVILLIIVIAAVGGAGYYFKIYRPKQQAAADTDEDGAFWDDEDYEEESGEESGEENNGERSEELSRGEPEEVPRK